MQFGTMDSLIDKFSGLYGLERESVAELLVKMDRTVFRKGEVIVRSGTFDDSIYILESGIWSGAKQASFGDAIVWFAFGGEAVVDIFCYNAQIPSKITIVSETDSTAWRIGKSRIDALCLTSIGIANVIRRIFETNAFHFEDEIVWLADKESARKRYVALIDAHPELILNVPLKKIASYLWMTPQSLSRIRASMNKE